MKIIKVEKCLDCINCEIGSVWITSGVTIYPAHCVFGKWKRTETGMIMTETSRKIKKIRNVNKIPSWCPLEDYKKC